MDRAGGNNNSNSSSALRRNDRTTTTTTGGGTTVEQQQQQQEMDESFSSHYSTATRRSSASNNSSQPRIMSLGFHFVPGKYDVICARGKDAWNHSGNKLFRSFIETVRSDYMQAETKFDRGAIVTALISSTKSRGEGFVKQASNGEWFILPDHASREKVGQMLRDSLSNKYRSSFKQKQKRRREIVADQTENLEEIVHSNKDIAQAMAYLVQTIRDRPMLCEERMYKIFLETNVKILKCLKEDPVMLSKFLSKN